MTCCISEYPSYSWEPPPSESTSPHSLSPESSEFLDFTSIATGSVHYLIPLRFSDWILFLTPSQPSLIPTASPSFNTRFLLFSGGEIMVCIYASETDEGKHRD